jgi:ABC-2 type transport system permease protein
MALDRPATQRVTLSPLGTLFWFTIRQHARGRRLLILALLFLLPALLAILIRSAVPQNSLVLLEFGLVLYVIPYTLVPLTAVLYASGMIQDEIEEQTLTYLLVRPLPKWSIYLVKLLATLVAAVALAAVFTFVTYVAMYAGDAGWEDALGARAPRMAVLFALSLVGYCCLFGCISLYTRWSLVASVAYLVIFEGLLANFDFVARKITFMYYFRVLARRWLPLDWAFIIQNRDPWSINLAEAPSAGDCVRTVLAVSLVATALAAVTFAAREFRLKTPEGS